LSFPVHLEVFDGPLDLLLQLVSRERVDVGQVSVAVITDDYLRAVEAMGSADLESATSFLILAATLLELKSVRLLPRPEADPETASLLEERDRLLQRLIEYATFKAAAAGLGRALEANEGYFTRAGGVPEELRATQADPLEGVTLEAFRRIAAAAFAPRLSPVPDGVDTSYIAPVRVSVAEMIEALADQLRRQPTASFRELCGAAASRAEVVARFLALLELFRQSCVEVEQADPSGGITVRWRRPRTGPERSAGDIPPAVGQ
jgi:segregation and condensation protein A